ncbi:MAG TPA: SDR family oxidoreductase, partial [Mycobacterium sp.]|nr:SDR family oxidoreductase [Mycobacterium sp.]
RLVDRQIAEAWADGPAWNQHWPSKAIRLVLQSLPHRKVVMILVIGGRSKIGSALLGELVGRGEQVRALVRAGEPGEPGERGGRVAAAAEIVTGDLADEASLVTAMAGTEKVFLLSSPHADAVNWHRNAIDAARRTEVQLLVRSSIIGADRDSPAEFVNAHTTCDRYLENSGLPFVIVRPNLFLQNIPESTIPSIDASGTFYADAGEARISMVDTRDVAAVAAAVLTEPGHNNAHYDVTGPQAVSYADVAAELTAALDRQITYTAAPDDAVRQALLGAGLNEWFADALIGLYQDYRRSGTDGYAAQVTDTVERITGRPARSLDDLLGETAPA